jgi:hypothetical protein
MGDVTRKNRRPVFIHGLQGGGTGILWNFLTSHADCLGPRYETNQIFMYNWERFMKAIPRPRQYGYQIPNMLALIPLRVATLPAAHGNLLLQ